MVLCDWTIVCNWQFWLISISFIGIRFNWSMSKTSKKTSEIMKTYRKPEGWQSFPPLRGSFCHYKCNWNMAWVMSDVRSKSHETLSRTWSCDPWYWLRRLWGWCQQILFFSPCKSRTSLLQQNLHNFIITSQFNFTLFMANYGVLKFDSFSLDCPVNSASRALTIRNNQTLIYYRNTKHFKARNLYPHTCTSCHLFQK